MRAVAALLLVLAGITSAPTQAHAKCGYGPLAERLARAELVFQGALIRSSRIAVDQSIVDDFLHENGDSSGVLGEFRVDKVWKGSVGSTINLLAEPIGCGNQFGVKPHVILAERVGPYVVAHACAGVPEDEQRAALSLLGPPKKVYASDATRDTWDASEPDGRADDRCWRAPSIAGVGFLGGTAVASFIFAWTARRRSRR